MNEDPSFLPEGNAPQVSKDFQDQVIDKIVRHHRRRQRAANLIVFGLVLATAYSYQRDRRALMEIEVRQGSRVISAARGVDWLLQTQQSDGRWRSETWGGHQTFNEGITALATLALLNAPDPVPAEALNRSIAALEESLAQQLDTPKDGPAFYNRVLTLHTLSEIQKLRPDQVRAVQLKNAFTQLLQLQLPDGGWGYPDEQPMGYQSGNTANSAVTWWVCQLLKNQPVPNLAGVESARERGEQWLQARRLADGEVAYRENADLVANAEDALFWMLAPPQVAKTNAVEFTAQDAYRDFFRLSRNAAAEELERIQEQQQQNGAWRNPEDRWWQAGGQVYLTALSILSQVPRGV